MDTNIGGKRMDTNSKFIHCPICNELVAARIEKILTSSGPHEVCSCQKCNTTLYTKPIVDADKEEMEYRVTHQEHYTQHKIQVMEFCHVNGLSWCASNIIKYVCRENKKNGLEDLYKARTYLNCLIQYKESGNFLPPDKLSGDKK